MAGTDQLLDFTILFEVGYLVLDGFVNLEPKNRERTARRIVVVSLLSLLGSSILEVLVSQVNEDVPAFGGPVLSIVWIASLVFVFGCSWKLYHSMLAYSGRIQSERVDTVELVEKRTAETLAPMEERIDKIEGIANALRTSVEQWNLKAPETLDAMKKASESTEKSVQWIYGWIELTKTDMNQITNRYEQWAEAHRNDAATIYLVSNKLESMVKRASILEEEIDDLLAEHVAAPEEDGSIDGAGDGSVRAGTAAESGVVATAETEGAVTGHKLLTRSDGLANRERGNNAQLKFCEEILRRAGKLVDNSIKEGTPDYVFYAPGTRNSRQARVQIQAVSIPINGTNFGSISCAKITGPAIIKVGRRARYALTDTYLTISQWTRRTESCPSDSIS